MTKLREITKVTSSLSDLPRPHVWLALGVVSVMAGIGTYYLFKGSAASTQLYMKPATADIVVGQTISVAVRINTNIDSVNAVQADISYPIDKLQFEGIDASTSVFGVEADSSASNGIVKIARGKIGRVTGDQMVATIIFKALTTVGTSRLDFKATSAAVSAIDNQNVLTNAVGTTFAVISSRPVPASPPAVDTTPPTGPSNLSSSAVKSSSAIVNWKASTDNIGVTGYNIFRDGTLIGTTRNTNFADTGLRAKTRYRYTVRAQDAAGNNSRLSPDLNVTTLRR